MEVAGVEGYRRGLGPSPPPLPASYSKVVSMAARLTFVYLLLASGLAGAEPKAATMANPPAATVAERIVARTNAARKEQRLSELTVSPALTAAAQGLANHMARTGQLSHSADGRTPVQRIEAQQYRWTFVAENIVYRSDAGVTPDATAELLLQQWLASPGHRQNMLSAEPTEMGAASARAANGAVYAVQVFARPLAP